MIDPRADQLLESGLQALSGALWRQRRRLNLLAFKAKVVKLVQGADDREDLPRAVGELESAVGLLRSEDSEVGRLMRAIGHHLQIPADQMTLAWLSGIFIEPWGQTFADHAVAYDRLLAELRSTMADNRALATGGAANIKSLVDEVASITVGPGTYDASGEKVDTRPRTVDQLL